MNDSESAAHVDSLIETRIERADAYLQHHLENQKNWYSDKVSQYKSYSQYLSFVVIASGAAIPFIQIFEALSEPVRFAATIARPGLVRSWLSPKAPSGSASSRKPGSRTAKPPSG